MPGIDLTVAGLAFCLAALVACWASYRCFRRHDLFGTMIFWILSIIGMFGLSMVFWSGQ